MSGDHGRSDGKPLGGLGCKEVYLSTVSSSALKTHLKKQLIFYDFLHIYFAPSLAIPLGLRGAEGRKLIRYSYFIVWNCFEINLCEGKRSTSLSISMLDIDL